MVGYIKQHFFVRYRDFDSWEHLNQRAVTWLATEADQRLHGTVREVVAERFEREAPHLKALPAVRYDTAYHERRHVAYDGYVEVRGNRYSVPHQLAGQVLSVRIGLDGSLRLYDAETLVASHDLRPRDQGWVSVPDHHAELWRQTRGEGVQQRDLAVYEELGSWS
jgi:hypothetical protein